MCQRSTVAPTAASTWSSDQAQQAGCMHLPATLRCLNSNCLHVSASVCTCRNAVADQAGNAIGAASTKNF